MAPDRFVPVAAHAGALLIGIALAGAGFTPWLVVPAFALLLARAAYGLSRFHRQVRPQVVGIQEMVYGFSFVLIVAAGYGLGF